MYIDLNMVRAGVVKHPKDWPFCGYQEISGQRSRNCLIDKKLLISLIGVDGLDGLIAVYQDWIMEALKSKDLSRKPKWTESVAVGGGVFIDKIKTDLGLKILHRGIIPDPVDSTGYVLKDPRRTYMKYKLSP